MSFRERFSDNEIKFNLYGILQTMVTCSIHVQSELNSKIVTLMATEMGLNIISRV